MKAFGIVAGSDQQRRRGVRPDAEEREQLWRSCREECVDHLVELGDLAIECLDTMRKRGHRGFGRTSDRIGRSSWAQLGPFGDETSDRESMQSAPELVRA